MNTIMATHAPSTNDDSTRGITQPLSLRGLWERITQRELQANNGDGPPPRRLRFIIDDGEQALDVPLRPNLTVGRRSSPRDKQQIDVDLSDYGASDCGVSRLHAMIHVTSARIMIKDLNSTNHTWLNGEKLAPMVETRLRHGDEIFFGRLRVLVQFLETSPTDTWRM